MMPTPSEDFVVNAYNPSTVLRSVRNLRPFALAIIASHVLAASAPAATVTYILDLFTTPGSFTLWAGVSDGDNQGLVSFSVPLIGTVTNLNNVSPFTVNSANFAPLGFDQLRTPGAPDPAAGPLVNPIIRGSQNVASGPLANLVAGFGQEASSWAAKGYSLAGFPDATTDIAWGGTPLLVDIGCCDHPIRLATGNYTGELNIDRQSPNLAASTWANVANRDAQAASVELCFPFCGLPGELRVDDLSISDGLPGDLITGGPLPTRGTHHPDEVDWLLESFIGPNGPVDGATVDPTTGVFTWQTQPADRRGLYSAMIRGTTTVGLFGTDTGLLTFELVPEPASFTLFGLAMVCGRGLVRRRNG
jgi:hypothetical protein